MSGNVMRAILAASPYRNDWRHDPRDYPPCVDMMPVIVRRVAPIADLNAIADRLHWATAPDPF